MSLFSIDDDVKAFLLRARETLDRVDILLKNGNDAITELREVTAAVRQALGKQATP